MKGSSHPTNDLAVNPSTHESIRDVIDRVEPGRRRFLQSSLGAATLSAAGGLTLALPLSRKNRWTFFSRSSTVRDGTTAPDQAHVSNS